MADKWLVLGDRLILDDADQRVVEVVLARSDRGSVQAVRITPELGGEDTWLLQIEDEDLLAAEPTEADALEAEEASIGEERFGREWTCEVRTERAAAGERAHFGRGECALYRSDAGVAVLVSDQRGATAFVGRALDPARVDLRFT